MACVFVFAIEGAAPVKIGHALNVPYRLRADAARATQGDHHRGTYLGARAPRRAALLAEDLKSPEAIDVVRKACALFPSRGIVEHDALMRQLADVGYTRAWAYCFTFL